MTTRKQAVGNLTADPELKFAQSGAAWVTFTVATNEGKDDKNVCFTRCKAFGELAENIATSLDKGARVIVHGREITEQWETNGEKRSGNVLIVDAIGPDLRFATAKVTRVSKMAATATAPTDPWASAPADVEPVW